MDVQLAELASTAASTVVKALATDAWEQMKSALGSLWRRVHADRAETVEAELVEARAELLAARDNGDDQIESGLIGEWAGRLRRLLVANPDLVVELRAIVAALPSTPAAVDGQSGQVEMRALASGQGRVYQAGRDMHIGDAG